MEFKSQLNITRSSGSLLDHLTDVQARAMIDDKVREKAKGSE
jgi:hypothetical protein